MSPFKAQEACLVNGCPGKAVKHGRCPAHAQALDRANRLRYPDNRPNSNQRGYGTEWEHVRLDALNKHPGCSSNGCHELASHVHHEPEYPMLGTDHRRYRLVPLCERHHNQETARQHGYGKR